MTGVAAPLVEERFRLATMASPAGIFLVDGSGDAIFANPRACAILGAEEPDLLGRGFLRFLHAEERERAIRRIAEVLVAGGEATNDYRLARDGGPEGWVRVRVAPVRDDAGRVTGIAGALEDITAQRQAEQQARLLEQKLQQTHKLESLGLLAGGVAHDFNNLLVGILGNATLAQMDVAPGSDAAQALLDLQLAAERATELTAQLLAYAGRGRIAEAPVELNTVVEETLSLLRSSLPSRARVRTVLADGRPCVTGDATRLRQVVLNLVKNAADALGDGNGEILVSTALQEVSAARKAGLAVDGGVTPGPHVLLEVQDTGCGMSPETLARIFDPFFTTKTKGRGLGLAATLGTIRAHRAGLEVQSAPGRGTTFRLLFPPCTRPLSEAPPRAEAARLDGHGAILVVDDDTAVRDVTRRLLSRQGFEILEAPDGAAGVERLREAGDRIRCVLLDLTMPGMDGAETFRRMREVKGDVRVIVTSGHSERTLATQFAGQGIAGILHKPFDLTTLLRTTEAALAG